MAESFALSELGEVADDVVETETEQLVAQMHAKLKAAASWASANGGVQERQRGCFGGNVHTHLARVARQFPHHGLVG